MILGLEKKKYSFPILKKKYIILPLKGGYCNNLVNYHMIFSVCYVYFKYYFYKLRSDDKP